MSDYEKVSRKFVKGEKAKSGKVACGYYQISQHGAEDFVCGAVRMSTDGSRVWSYEHFLLAEKLETGSVLVNLTEYQVGEWPKSGKPKYSQVTKRQRLEVISALRREGFREVGIGTSENHPGLWSLYRKD